jgi:hypothetical protein
MTGAITAIGIGLGASAAAAATVGAFAVGGLAVAGAGLGYTIASGEDAKKKQAAALSRQESAQTQAVSAAERQRQTSEMAINQANRKKPDVSSIMQAAGESASGGAAGTMLTGPTGVNPNALSLGKSTLLGS